MSASISAEGRALPPLPALSSCPSAQRAAITRLFFDVDDTLTWQGRLPEEAMRALYRARAAGLTLCAVTGRSFAWGEMLVRLFPLDAVVAETGASALYFDGAGRLQTLHHEEASERRRLRAHREAVADDVLALIAGSRLAEDNVGRIADSAFDLVESGDPLPEADIQRLIAVLHARGLSTARSSVHVNAFVYGAAGPFNKASMVDRLLQTMSNTTLSEASSTLCYVGDSVNDGPLWARAGIAVGVANVVPLLPALSARGQAPHFLVDGQGGYGFAQVVNDLLEARDLADVLPVDGGR